MSVLDIKNLSVDYIGENSATTALKNISISLSENEILGVVGESGCGKSTLIKSIMRILNAPGLITSGDIDFDNHKILAMSDEELYAIRWKDISLVKQKALNSLNPVSKIGSQLSLPFQFHLGLSKEESEIKARELLELVNIDQKYYDSYPHELSGGMRQRVIIGIALALKPKLIIMDEPTTALDVITEREIINNIQELQKSLGFSVIFITHDLNLLMQFADNICVLYDGEIVDYGTSKQIGDGGKHYYTRTLLNSIPNINKSISNFKPKNQSSNKILSLDNISVNYQLGSWLFPDVLHAVNGVSLDLYSGHITSIIGESGSGKSTIAKVICGLETLSDGELTEYFDDSNENINFDLDYRKNVQMIFQDPFSALNPIHSVFHHLKRPLIRFGMEDRANLWDKACEILEMVELDPAEEFLNKYPHEMSGGECQRVCIARALCSHPKLIIADEPTSMLDVSIRNDILMLFNKLKEKYNTGIMLITHDIASAAVCSDHMIVLKKGRVVESGSAKEIIESPKDKYTKSLISASKSDWFKNNKESKDSER